MRFNRFMRNFWMDAEPEPGATGSAQPDTPPAGEGAQQDPASDGSKTGTEDVKSEAQKIADAMVAKKMKGMPTKEELAAFKQWQESQQTEAEKAAEAQREAAAIKAEADRKNAEADAKLAALSAGIQATHLDDAVILALARVTEELPIEEAIKTVAANNPTWAQASTNLPDAGGNPAGGSGDKKDTYEPPIII